MDPLSPKREYSLRKRKKNKKCKSIESSDSDDSDYIPIESDYDSEEEEFDTHEYRKLLQKIFPSKHLEQDIKSHEELDRKLSKKKKQPIKTGKKICLKTLHKEVADDTKSTSPKAPPKKTKNVKYKELEAKIPTDNAEDTASDISTSDDEEEEEEFTEMWDNVKNNFNIIFSLGKLKSQYNYEDYEDEDDEEDDEEDEEDEENEENDEEDDEDSGDEGDVDATGVEEKDIKLIMSQTNVSRGKAIGALKTCDNDIVSAILDLSCNNELEEKENKFVDHLTMPFKRAIGKPKKTKSKKSTKAKTAEPKEHETYEQLVELLRAKEEGNEELFKKFDTIVKKEKEKKETLRKKKEKKDKLENSKKLGKLFREKKTTTDIKYFKEQELDSQIKILDELRDINKYSDITKPYRMALIESDMPTKYKAVAYRKINALMYMDPGSGEYHKIKNWVDTFMSIPFGKYHSLPLTIKDGIETCNAFMENAKKILDDAVYGLNDAKMQILQVIGQWIANPDSVGTAIAIKGPMGTGKTTLVKEGISKLLNRPFAFLALGGATDSAFLEGHSYTYEGSKWGHIVEILRQSKCMNPVIYFDELDKVSETPKGEEITGILTHLTDTIQNTQFHDKYFSQLEFDLSKCLFIFSYNDETKINPILCDRMYRIETKGYDKKDKTIIAQKYLIPKIEQNVGFESGQIVFDDSVIHTLIEHHTQEEKGVRNLKRCLEIIYTKINLFRLMKPDTKLYDAFEFIKIEYPFQVTADIIGKLIKTEETPQWLSGMYV